MVAEAMIAAAATASQGRTLDRWLIAWLRSPCVTQMPRVGFGRAQRHTPHLAVSIIRAYHTTPDQSPGINPGVRDVWTGLGSPKRCLVGRRRALQGNCEKTSETQTSWRAPQVVDRLIVLSAVVQQARRRPLPISEEPRNFDILAHFSRRPMHDHRIINPKMMIWEWFDVVDRSSHTRPRRK